MYRAQVGGWRLRRWCTQPRGDRTDDRPAEKQTRPVVDGELREVSSGEQPAQLRERRRNRQGSRLPRPRRTSGRDDDVLARFNEPVHGLDEIVPKVHASTQRCGAQCQARAYAGSRTSATWLSSSHTFPGRPPVVGHELGTCALGLRLRRWSVRWLVWDVQSSAQAMKWLAPRVTPSFQRRLTK